jgi:hypothetical protein
MAEEKPVEEKPVEEEKLVTVTLKVSMSAGEFGYTGAAGDQVEVPAATAEAWIAAGIAEPAAAPRAASGRQGAAAPDTAATGASHDEPPRPSVPRRNAS